MFGSYLFIDYSRYEMYATNLQQRVGFFFNWSYTLFYSIDIYFHNKYHYLPMSFRKKVRANVKQPKATLFPFRFNFKISRAIINIIDFRTRPTTFCAHSRLNIPSTLVIEKLYCHYTNIEKKFLL